MGNTQEREDRIPGRLGDRILEVEQGLRSFKGNIAHMSREWGDVRYMLEDQPTTNISTRVSESVSSWQVQVPRNVLAGRVVSEYGRGVMAQSVLEAV